MNQRTGVWIAVVVLAVLVPLGLMCGARRNGPETPTHLSEMPKPATGEPVARLIWSHRGSQLSARIENLTNGELSIQCTGIVIAHVEEGFLTKDTRTPDQMLFDNGDSLFATIQPGSFAVGTFKNFNLNSLPSNVELMDGNGRMLPFEERME
jgi:hypothetical protein